eukprot:5384027-Prymnesium_polylepis.2
MLRQRGRRRSMWDQTSWSFIVDTFRATLVESCARRILRSSNILWHVSDSAMCGGFCFVHCTRSSARGVT